MADRTTRCSLRKDFITLLEVRLRTASLIQLKSRGDLLTLERLLERLMKAVRFCDSKLCNDGISAEEKPRLLVGGVRGRR